MLRPVAGGHTSSDVVGPMASGPGAPLHVEDGAPPAARTDEPFPSPSVAEPEGTTPHSARRHPHPAPRTHRRLPRGDGVAQRVLLRFRELRALLVAHSVSSA